MTPEERQMLNDLASKVAQTPPPPRDAEAEELIRTKIGSRPDALYLMTQTVLIQNLALEHARQEIQQLQQQLSQGSAPARSSSSFLGGAGAQGPSNWGAPQAQAGPGQQGSGRNTSQSAPPPTYTAVPASGGSSGGGSSFLRGAAQTAAGVAAGALAFEGMRSLFGGVEHMAGFGGPGYGSGLLGGGYGASGVGGAPGETIINNYYDSPDQAGNDVLADNDQVDDQTGDQTDDTVDDAQYDDAQYDDSGDDSGDYVDDGSSDTDLA
jgi:uncharacterized protein